MSYGVEDWTGLGVTLFVCIRTDSGGSTNGRIGFLGLCVGVGWNGLAGYPICTLDNIESHSSTPYNMTQIVLMYIVVSPKRKCLHS